MKTLSKLALGITLASVFAVAQVSATTIAQWTFENAANTNGLTLAPGAGNPFGPVSPDVGSGSNNALHATAATYSTPAGDLDPNIAAMDAGASAANSSPSSRSISANNWSVGDYWQFKVSTLGYSTIQVAWDQTGSNTGPRDFQLSYSLDGTSFTAVSNYSLAFAAWNATSVQPNSYTNISFGGAIDNATTVWLRLVDQTTTSVNGGSVAAAGTDRVDNFTVIGTVVPEPSTMLLVGFGIIGMVTFSRRRFGRS